MTRPIIVWIYFLLVVPFSLISFCFANQQPLQIKNMMPVSQLYGLPRPMGADFFLTGSQLRMGFEVTNNFSGARKDNDEVFYDGETYWTTFSARHVFGGQASYEVGLTMPYISHGPGYLDGFVDRFHNFFGFPNGSRNMALRNQLDYRIRFDGEYFLDFQSKKSNFGDLRAWFGYQLFRTNSSALAMRATIKFPTGYIADMTGSGAADFSIWAEYQNSDLLNLWRLNLTFGGGVTFLGEGDLLPSRQKAVAGIFHFGIQRALANRGRLIAQLDGHTRLLETPFDQVGGFSLQGTLGGRIAIRKSYWLDFGLVENLTGDSAPDFTLQLALTGQF